MSNFGVPATVATDRGSQSKSTLFRELTSLLSTNRTRTTAYHPQANGLFERFHRQIETALMAQPDPSRWSDHLPLVMLSLRSTLKAAIGCTAADLFYGTSLQMPIMWSGYVASCAISAQRLLGRRRPIPSSLPTWIRAISSGFGMTLSGGHSNGPYRALRRSDKDVVIDRNGKTDTDSIDRVKPAYIDDSDHSSPQHCTPPQTVMPPHLLATARLRFGAHDLVATSTGPTGL
ncbi:hypothetical protein SprV_0100237800 [Sparganum proliferum]